MKAGDKFNFKGFEWVALEMMMSEGKEAVMAVMTKAWAEAPFDERNRNNWEESSIRKKLQEELLPVLGEDNLVTRMVDLTADNGDNRYGMASEKIWLLSCDDFRKYREIILNNCKIDCWWTLTPWYIDNVGYGYTVRYVYTSGAIHYTNAYNTYGVAPACIINLESLNQAPTGAESGTYISIDQVTDLVNATSDGRGHINTGDLLRHLKVATEDNSIEIVRCKDCIAADQNDDQPYCTAWGRATNREGFCDAGIMEEEP